MHFAYMYIQYIHQIVRLWKTGYYSCHCQDVCCTVTRKFGTPRSPRPSDRDLNHAKRQAGPGGGGIAFCQAMAQLGLETAWHLSSFNNCIFVLTLEKPRWWFLSRVSLFHETVHEIFLFKGRVAWDFWASLLRYISSTWDPNFGGLFNISTARYFYKRLKPNLHKPIGSLLENLF